MNFVIIGCGVIGSIFARHFSSSHRVILYDKNHERARDLSQELNQESSSSLHEIIKKADVILLAIKPSSLSAFGREIKGCSLEGKILISVLAGTPTSSLAQVFSDARIVRIMPNIAMKLNQGIIGIVEEPSFSREFKKQIEALFDKLGLLLWIHEEKMDAFTALAGSSPALFLLLVEAFTETGVYLGFSGADSQKIALQVLRGVTALLEKENTSPADLRLQIASPGGTTISGLLMAESLGLRHALQSSLVEIYKKSQKMH